LLHGRTRALHAVPPRLYNENYANTGVEEVHMTDYSDIILDIMAGVARITINRPDRYNAFRARTCDELIDAFTKAGWDRNVGVIVLTGAGDKAFCTGGDQGTHEGGYGGRGTIGLPLEELHGLMRHVPKPVIARVNGFAIGGGNVLVTVSDLAIASDKAVLGQVGPRVGSVDPGFGTAYLARVVGEKKAREIWFLCRRYNAQQALEMGLVNCVVPHAELDAEVDKWCQEILALSPTAIAIAKRACNADSDNIHGISALGMQAVKLFYETPESKEGVAAFNEKRPPRFR
jgi:2-ketocyclohexanecarboxyl-CoA hydrolase